MCLVAFLPFYCTVATMFGLSLPRPRVESFLVTSPILMAPRVVMEEVEEDNEEYNDEDYELDDIYVRSKFFESWLWTDVKLPDAPVSDG